MAERFNLTAQIQLQAPTNTAQVVGQIKKQLQGINVDVKVKANSAQVAKLNKELQGVSKAGEASAKSVNRLNATLAQSARRFSVITVATGSFLALARGIKNGTAEAIAFERELVKISQVTGKSVSQLQGLTKEVTRLSTSLGASSSDLLNVSRTLAQAGFNATKTKQALETLAQTTLAATFDSIQDTTEGAIAVLRQFSAEARASGGEVKFLASTMDAINSVSKRFAVESGDLITAIRRVGGVFSSAGGSVNELIALFTSVRATTRESAETIATGLRTIFTRIQRTDTVDQLKQLGIQLRDSQGQFVGAYEAVRRLSAGLSTIDPRDFRFSDIVESLGGFRQVGKVIPLIQQFAIAQDALTVAQNSSGSVARDAAAAQAGLGVQITKVKEEFTALLRQFADSSTFRSVAGGALQLASAFLKIASALENVLPLITTLISLKIGQALAPGLGALLGGVGLRRKNQGGKIHGFARGGFVPGTGNRDTVPAMLQPGEFVIKKSSASKLGASTLEAMNNNKYARGGVISASADDLQSAFNRKRVLRQKTQVKGNLKNPSVQMNKGDSFSTNLTTEYLPSRIPARDSQGRAFKNAGKQISSTKFEDLAQRRFGGRDGGGGALDLVGGNLPTEVKRTKGNVSNAVLIDKLIRSFAQQEVSNQGGQSGLTGKRNDRLRLRPMRVVYSDQQKSLLPRTAISLGEQVKQTKRRASGGSISGSDTVPALLTPGEFVINKSSAQSIGYSNLSKMNQTGVKRFAAGGAVDGVQRFADGGLSAAPAASFGKQARFAAQGAGTGVANIAGAAQQFVFLGAAVAAVGAQFTSLEETTQSAISATAASVTSIVGIVGTLVQVLTAATVSSTAAAAADTAESAASLKAAAAQGGFTKGLGLIAIGLTAAYTAAEFFRQTLIAESQALTKSINETIEKLEKGEGTGSSLAREQTERLAKDVAANESGSGLTILGTLVGGIVGLGVAAKAAAVVAGALATTFGLATAPIGLVVVAITGLVALLGGWIGNQKNANDAVAEGARVAKLEEQALRESADARVASIESLRLLNQSIDEFNQRNFTDTPEGRSARIQARGGIVSQGLSSFGGGITAEANNRLKALAQQLNKTTSELTAADFKGDNVRLKGEFENLIDILDKNADGLKTTLQQAQTNFAAAVKEDVTGELGFDELRAKGGNFAKTLNDLQQATRASFQAEKQRLRALVDTTKVGTDARKKAVEQLEDTTKREQKILAQQIKYGQDVVAGAQERYAADIQAAQAAQELSQRLDEISKFGRSVSLLTQSVEDAAKQMDLAIAAFSDGDIKVEIPAISGLTDPTNIADPARFDAQIDSLIADLPRAMRAEAGRQADTVRQASDLFGDFRSSVRTLEARSGKEQTLLSEEILAASGVKISGDLRKTTLSAIRDALGKQGGITDEDFDKIFSFARDEANEAAKHLQDLEKARQTELATYQKHIGAINEQRSREDAARQKLLERELKNQELLAKARGESVDIEKREALRTAAAQDRLRGTGIRAGDARGAINAIDQARVRREEIANELAEARASGVDLGAKKFKELALEQDKYNNIIKRGKAELERLSSQGARASDILGEIAKEAQGRKQLASLATGFAFGSDEQRQSTAIALRDTRLGIQSGFQRRGLAGATAQQRANVDNILSQLSDFRFRGVKGKDGKDLTGREIRAELAAQEIVRVTGDLEAAAAIREQVLKGSKEEQLITALGALTTEMEEVRKVIAKNERLSSEAIAIGKARGGLIYREDGGSIFQPKGTDTVPAMLTPGEFVIRKSAVDRIGVGTLQALNSGSSQYFHVGGRVHDHPHPRMPPIGTRQSLGYIRASDPDPTNIDQMEPRGFGNLTEEQVRFRRELLSPPGVRLRTPKREMVSETLSTAQDFQAARRGQREQRRRDIIRGLTGGRRAPISRLFLGEKTGGSAVPGGYYHHPRTGRTMRFHSFSRRRQFDAIPTPGNKGFSDIADDFRMFNNFKDRPGGPKADAETKKRVAGIAPDRSSVELSPALPGRATQAAPRRRTAPPTPTPTPAIKSPSLGEVRDRARKRADAINAKIKKLGEKRIGGLTTEQLVRQELDKIAPVTPRDPLPLPGQGMSESEKKRKGLTQKAIRFFADGGAVGTSDTVPAMLTPGEFVMSKEAVQSHGVGYMKQLNKAHIPGFRRGGVVGHGNVQYRQEGGQIGNNAGGILGLDTSNLSSILDNFNSDLMSGLDNVVSKFTGFSESFTLLSQSFSNLQMQHSFTGDMTLAFNITNTDAIKNAVATGITPKIVELIRSQITTELNRFKAGNS